jgi:DNA topoisomerase-2
MSSLTVSDFLNGDMREYSKYDNDRSIPNIMDGLKITQRKVIKTMLNGRENSNEIKVAQLASYVAAETDYHHGEGSVSGSIVTMALNYPGTNNYQLMVDSGQFGSRINPVSAADRYIFTQLSPNFRKFFKKEDDAIVTPQYSDGMEIEPEFFIPVVPMILLNSVSGIGTGFACDIQPREIEPVVEAIRSLLQGKAPLRIPPAYRGFKGTVESGDSESQWIIRGVARIANTTTIEISELPIGLSLVKLQTHLISMMEAGVIKGYDDNSNKKSGFKITVHCTRDYVARFKKQDQLLKEFKLITKVSENLTVWLPNGKLKNFTNEIELIKEFLKLRLPYLQIRKDDLLNKMSIDIAKKTARMKFIRIFLANSKSMLDMTKQQIIDFCVTEHGMEKAEVETNLQIRIYDITADMIPKLEEELSSLVESENKLRNTTTESIYLSDLKAVLK